jgi:hypothetical protein
MAMEKSPDRDQMLFELFLKRESIREFTHDFDDIRALLGEEDENDPYNWSQVGMPNRLLQVVIGVDASDCFRVRCL